MGNRDGRAMTYPGKHEYRATSLRIVPGLKRFLAAFHAYQAQWMGLRPAAWKPRSARGGVFGTSPRVACRLQAHLAAASAADADDDFGTPLAGRNPTPRAGSATHEAYFRRPDQGSLSERAP
jgi:hypothetical protein